MTAYVAKKPDGSIVKGWILKSGTSINSSMCRPPSPERSREIIEEVPVDVVLGSAAGGSAPKARLNAYSRQVRHQKT